MLTRKSKIKEIQFYGGNYPVSSTNGILKRLGEGTYRLKENYSNTMCEPCLGHDSNEPTVENI